jgi:hypothetical protein
MSHDTVKSQALLVYRSGPATPPDELEQATSRLLGVLRPAA